MAATKSQGKEFGLFLGGLTAVCAGMAYSTTGIGKVALILGLVTMAVSLWGFLRIKPLEGKTGNNPQPAVMKLIGIVVVFGGWLFVLFGLHLTSGVGARFVTSIVGVAISLIGIFAILAPAASKNAIWKA